MCLSPQVTWKCYKRHKFGSLRGKGSRLSRHFFLSNFHKIPRNFVIMCYVVQSSKVSLLQRTFVQSLLRRNMQTERQTTKTIKQKEKKRKNNVVLRLRKVCCFSPFYHLPNQWILFSARSDYQLRIRVVTCPGFRVRLFSPSYPKKKNTKLITALLNAKTFSASALRCVNRLSTFSQRNKQVIILTPKLNTKTHVH